MRPRMPRAAEVAPWLERMDASRLYSNFGPLVRELEAAHAARLGVPPERLVSVANATLGLEGAVAVSPAETWVVPDFTFPASVHAVLAAGKSLEFGDISPDDWQLDTVPIHERADTLGIMPVLPFGAGIRLDKWRAFPHVVLDAAASLGSEDLDLTGLPATWAVVFSLHATKVLPAGEGGLVVFGSEDQARRFRAWSNFGFAGTRLSSIVGTNAKMSELTAAYALASLSGWTTERTDWMRGLSRANAIADDLGIASPVQRYRGVHPYWVVQFETAAAREHAEAILAERGIETRLWWPAALHQMPAFTAWAPAVPTPHCVHAAATALGLPMHRDIGGADIDSVGEALRVALKG